MKGFCCTYDVHLVCSCVCMLVFYIFQNIYNKIFKQQNLCSYFPVPEDSCTKLSQVDSCR